MKGLTTVATPHTARTGRAAARVFLLLAAVLAMIVGTTMFAATARADAGIGTIGRDATNGSWNGTYETPTAEGDQEGWCIDPGLPEPKANGNSDPYGEPINWDAPNSQQKMQLIAALTLGEAASEAKAAGAGDIRMPGIENILSSADVDTIGAAVSGVVHKIGFDADPAAGASWDPNVLDPESRAVYDNLLQFADRIPGINTDVPLMIREPTGAGAGHQRMLLIGDVELPEIPKIELPEIQIPDIQIPDIQIPDIQLPEINIPTPQQEPEPEPEPGKIHVNKYDQDGERLTGAEFEIRKGDENGEVLYTWDTENEVMTFLVDAGDYTIIELTPPEGYTGEFSETVTVDEGEEVTLDVTNEREVEPEPEPEPEPTPETVTEQAPAPTVTVTQAPPPAPEPVVEQPRATIVSVPSGPTGNAPLPAIK